jgi:ABC-2 type transport system ATP-binding protein
MTVGALLRFLARIRGVPPDRERERMAWVVERCGLREVAGRLVGNLSKGYRQRVGIAGTLIHDPQVLLLDEPTAGLDPKQIVEIRALVKELGRERTVLLSTHILPEVETICRRVLIINRGRIVASDTIEALESEGKEGARISLLVEGDDDEVRKVLTGTEGVRSVKVGARGSYEVQAEAGKDPRAEMARALALVGVDLLEMRPAATSLEEVFMRAVAAEPEVES